MKSNFRVSVQNCLTERLIIIRINMVTRSIGLPVPSNYETFWSRSSYFTFLAQNENEPMLCVFQARLSLSSETEEFFY